MLKAPSLRGEEAEREQGGKAVHKSTAAKETLGEHCAKQGPLLQSRVLTVGWK